MAEPELDRLDGGDREHRLRRCARRACDPRRRTSPVPPARRVRPRGCVPPSVSPSLFAASTASTILFSDSASSARSGESSRTLLERNERARGFLVDDRAERENAARHLDAAFAEQELADGAGRDARRRLASGGPLEDVAQVLRAELHSAGQVSRGRGAGASGVSRGAAARSTSRGPMTRSQLAWSRLRDPDGDGRAERDAAADAALEDRLVLLDLHATSAPVAVLPARELRDSTKPGSIRRPAGIPSRIAVRRGPCDSPAVVSLRGMAESLAQVRGMRVIGSSVDRTGRSAGFRNHTITRSQIARFASQSGSRLSSAEGARSWA